MANTSNLHFDRRIQILLLVLVVFIGVGGTALGALNVRSSILNPFAYEGSNSVTVPNTLSQEGPGFLDTDGDGLLDDEELNNYGTSPYLADSDSDGISDGEEIARGSDPNCPAGQDCRVGIDTGVDNAVNQENSANQVTANELRNVLIQQGLPRDQIDALSDEQILQAYQSAVNGTVPQSTSPNLDQLQNLSPDEIRSLLIDQGVDRSLIENMPDSQLVELYKTSLEATR